MDPKETAVIFIEFQNDFCSEGGKLFGLVREEIERNRTIANARRLLEGVREKGCLIIHCPFVLNSQWARAIRADGILASILENDIFARDSWGHEIIDALRPLEGEIVLGDKRALSAFSWTGLDEILQSKNVRNVVVCGFLTNICAQATALSAYDRGYRVRMAFDACGAASEEIQSFCVTNVAPILGGPTTTDAILASIS
ncbi:MAG: cysteine hydrolase [Planctomycetia bacterium]|nr:cysteine hydrolase [Planctomycetia bacterium]